MPGIPGDSTNLTDCIHKKRAAEGKEYSDTEMESSCLELTVVAGAAAGGIVAEATTRPRKDKVHHCTKGTTCHWAVDSRRALEVTKSQGW